MPKVSRMFPVTRCWMETWEPGFGGVVGRQRIDGELRNAREFLNLAADLAGHSLRHDRLRADAGGRREWWRTARRLPQKPEG